MRIEIPTHYLKPHEHVSHRPRMNKPTRKEKRLSMCLCMYVDGEKFYECRFCRGITS